MKVSISPSAQQIIQFPEEFEIELSSSEDKLNHTSAKGTIPVHVLTKEQAKAYGEELKEAWMKHWLDKKLKYAVENMPDDHSRPGFVYNEHYKEWFPVNFF